MRGDTGSVAVLVLGLVGILVGLVAVVTDASAALLARRGVQSVADGAATAAGQQVDEARVVREGVTPLLPLDRREVLRAVRSYGAPAGTTLRARVDGATAVVVAQRTVRLPLTRRLVVVRASATVQHAVRG